MRRAFTLMELLIVMGLMGMLGTMSIGGYMAMKRGMEERGVMQNVNSFIRAAYQRAQIDRLPVTVYFWNETIRSRTKDEYEIVVGKAVAVRRAGRLSGVRGKLLIDEFGDLDRMFPTDDQEQSNSGDNGLIYLYPMQNLSQNESSKELRRSEVKSRVTDASDTVNFLSGSKSGDGSDYPGQIIAWAFDMVNDGKVSWHAGDAYGFEFQNLTLPHNYIFGDSRSTSVENPIVEAGTLVFDIGYNSGNGINQGGVIGNDNITVSSLRQKGTDFRPDKVGTSDPPNRRL